MKKIILLCIISIAVPLFANNEKDRKEDNESNILIGIETGKEDLLHKSNIYVSPLIEFEGYDMELRLQWKKNMFPENKYDALAFSAKKEFKNSKIFIWEIENENTYSFIGEDSQGVFIIETTWNLKNLWPGIEFPFVYLPNRKISIAPVMEFGLESNRYGNIKFELLYSYELFPQKRPEGYEIKLKYELAIFDRCELRFEFAAQYNFIEKVYALQPELAISYIF